MAASTTATTAAITSSDCLGALAGVDSRLDSLAVVIIAVIITLGSTSFTFSTAAAAES